MKARVPADQPNEASDHATELEALRKVAARLVKLNRELESQIDSDLLTGLLNRRGLQRALTREIGRAERTSGQLCVAFFDLDDFKSINEKYGHAIGDQLLKAVAQRMRSSLRDTDYVARIGGDEFMVLMPDTSIPLALRTTERAVAALARTPVLTIPEPVSITMSAGISEIPLQARSLEELLGLTRVALQKAKRQGKNRASSIESAADNSIDFQARLLDSSKFQVVFHQIVELARGSVVAYEALIRGPQQFESPGELFDYARRINAMTLVDLSALRRCVDESLKLPGKERIHFNLLPSTLQEVGAASILQILQPLLNRRPVCIELSEKQLVGDPLLIQMQVQELKSAGVVLALDHVMFGRSSLESLVVLEPETVKLDIACVSGISLDQRKLRAVSKLLSLVRAIGCVIIATGIENDGDRKSLLELQVQLGEGWLFGQPRTPVAERKQLQFSRTNEAQLAPKRYV